MLRVELPVREQDDYGAGYYGAPRGDKTHKGTDYACYPGTRIYSPCAGTVTKLGYPYGDDLSYRYVEISDNLNNKHRYFYVEPAVMLHEGVKPGTLLGVAQDLRKRYPKTEKKEAIINHVHYEVIRHNGLHVPPDKLVA